MASLDGVPPPCNCSSTRSRLMCCPMPKATRLTVLSYGALRRGQRLEFDIASATWTHAAVACPQPDDERGDHGLTKVHCRLPDFTPL
jgi:hypothetical protein